VKNPEIVWTSADPKTPARNATLVTPTNRYTLFALADRYTDQEEVTFRIVDQNTNIVVYEHQHDPEINGSLPDAEYMAIKAGLLDLLSQTRESFTKTAIVWPSYFGSPFTLYTYMLYDGDWGWTATWNETQTNLHRTYVGKGESNKSWIAAMANAIWWVMKG
jgi:hypothetical protein